MLHAVDDGYLFQQNANNIIIIHLDSLTLITDSTISLDQMFEHFTIFLPKYINHISIDPCDGERNQSDCDDNMTNTNNFYDLLSNVVTNLSIISNLTVVNCSVLLYSSLNRFLWQKRIEKNLKRVNFIIFCLHFCPLIRILYWIALLRALLYNK